MYLNLPLNDNKLPGVKTVTKLVEEQMMEEPGTEASEAL